MAHILVGCPVAERYAYCIEPYLAALEAQDFKDFELMLADNSEKGEFSNALKNLLSNTAIKSTLLRAPYSDNVKDRVVQSRNIIRDHFLKGEYSHFWSLEIDVIPPADALSKLLSRKKDILSGVYFKEFIVNIEKDGRIVERKKTRLPLLYAHSDLQGKMRRLLRRDVEEPRLMDVRSAGLGCLLITKSVLDKVVFRHVPDNEGWDDVWFCNDAIDAGYKIWADTSIHCEHLEKGKGNVWGEYDLVGRRL